MNVKYIQARTGLESELQKNKLRKGEVVATTDTKKVLIAFKDGDAVDFDGNVDVVELVGSGALVNLRSTVSALTQNLGAVDSDISAIRTQLSSLLNSTEQKFGYAEVGEVDKCLYIFDKVGGKLLAGPLGPFAGEGGGSGGGGGGGSSTVTTMDMNNTTGWATRSISQDADCILSYTWSSTKDELPTGEGTLQVYVNGASKGAPRGVSQGAQTINIKSFLTAGTNSIRLQITDAYGTIRYLVFTVTVVSVSLSSGFDSSAVYQGAFNFPYVAYGNVTKVVHFKVDNTELSTETVDLSGRQMTKTIPAQTHGTHRIEAWFIADVDGVEVESNHVVFEFMAITEGSTDPVISSDYAETSVTQYSTIAIPYQVYDPLNATAAVTLAVNGETVSTISVDRTQQTWSYRPMDVGELTLAITCRTTTKTFVIDVEESSATIHPVTEGLSLYLTAEGRSNGEADPSIWGYEDISATLTNFNFTSDGWQLDASNNTALRVAGDARVTIPAKLFELDARSTGKTIEIEFATSRVRNYDTQIISCWSGDRGIQVTAQQARLKSAQTEIASQFKENEHERVSFVVTKRADGRMMYIYNNGVMSQGIQYPDNDDFSQMDPVGISIGSNDCTTDIYCIRVYDVALDRYQIRDNFVADTQNVDLMLARFEENDLFDTYGNIVISKLPKALPYLVLQTQGTHLPQYKGDKVTLSGYYVDPLHPEKSFTFTNAQFDVQGTSSQDYKRKNYKGKFKGGFVIAGILAGTYALSENSIPTFIFCFKADVASSEGYQNTCGAMIYNDTCKYKTPAQLADDRVRQGVEGYPIVIFEDDGDEITFIGKYNFNNDKGTPEVYGLGDDESIEYKNNTSDRCLFKSADFSGDAFLSDFEWSNPEDLNDPAQIAEFYEWVVSCDTDKATGDALQTPVEYGGVTYTTDTADYRLAKFKAESSNYFMVNQTLFYYLYTWLMLMVDSRAKNQFLTFWGSEVA